MWSSIGINHFNRRTHSSQNLTFTLQLGGDEGDHDGLAEEDLLRDTDGDHDGDVDGIGNGPVGAIGGKHVGADVGETLGGNHEGVRESRETRELCVCACACVWVCVCVCV